MSTLIFVLTTNGDEYPAQTRISCSCACSFLTRRTADDTGMTNDRRIERRLTASSWGAELCDARGLGPSRAPLLIRANRGNEGSQGIVLGLKISPALSSISPVKTL